MAEGEDKAKIGKRIAAVALALFPGALGGWLFFFQPYAMFEAAAVALAVAPVCLFLISRLRTPNWPDLPKRGPHPDGPRNIILLSDGTGNSSGKLLKTNVWRFYEAIDLGKPSFTKDGPVQLAYYDNGVGTSSVQILAALGGVFGFGLSRNVRDMYKFLCRNYHEGDTIHALGFSRGAFTIRLLVAMICEKGVISYQNEGDLDLQARDVWREFRRKMVTANDISEAMVRAIRYILRGCIRVKRRALGQRDYAAALNGGARRYTPYGVAAHHPDVDFVGVWDTVAAYGGPIVELTRAFDQWIWPLTMNNYHLHEKVLCARHALAIDDKRDAFTPLPWDEVHEKELVAKGRVNPDRLQQVWFTGMHADVGGGYADESLSFVSLVWMMDHAESKIGKAGINLLPTLSDRIRVLANAFGPIHDSRGGPGLFYRYQPRYIKAWVDPPPDYTQTYRDPTIGEKNKGLLVEPIRLHSSVVERIKSGTDGYAPINIPTDYCVDHGTGGPCSDRHTITNDGHLAHIGDLIGKRRTWYFVSFWLVSFLLLLPFLPDAVRQISIKGYLPLGEVADSRSATFPLEALANMFLPSFAQAWARGYSTAPFTVFILVALIVGSNARGMSKESQMAEMARSVWRAHFEGHTLAPAPKAGLRRKLRQSNRVQTPLGWWKWWIVPNLLGLLLLAVIVGLTLATFAQTRLAVLEDAKPVFDRNDPSFPAIGCRQVAGQPVKGLPDGAKRFTINIADACTDLGMIVGKGKSYAVAIKPIAGEGEKPCTTGLWCDGKVNASPDGRENDETMRTVKEWLAAPFRRVMSKPQMVPLFKTYGDRDTKKLHSQWQRYWGCLWAEKSLTAKSCQQWKVQGRNLASLNHVRLTRSEAGDVWRGRYQPAVDGNLQFFLNEAVDPSPYRLLFAPWTDYANNWGRAEITLYEVRTNPLATQIDRQIREALEAHDRHCHKSPQTNAGEEAVPPCPD